MSLFAKKQQILKILVENLKNAQPQVVNSKQIAARLNMTVKDTCNLMKIMNEKGIVISDGDGQRSLITRQGMQCLSQLNYL